MKLLLLEDLRKLDQSKLDKALTEEMEELTKVRFKVKSGQSKDSHNIKVGRTNIARIKTVLVEKAKLTK